MEQVDLTQVLFLDIETVSAYRNYEDMPEHFQELWQIKAKSFVPADAIPGPEAWAAAYRDRAGIFAEFGKIICISVGVLRKVKENEEFHVVLKSFAGDDEGAILRDFSDLLRKSYFDPNKHYLCGHNIKEFDVPYICRRMVVHRLPLPNLLDLSSKKPWETKFLLDTMEHWKFGDRKSYTSLKLLAALLDFPSPKEDIDGSQVGRVYWEENDLPRIALYCEKDVLATVQLALRFKRLPILEPGQVVHREFRR
ncbi:MAG: ribonuclease H-like domain-containing protein [Haliscomenobacter sp.]|nr:ribonuclease H-like domain-containing protein [Haliscomenobacter sp.]